MKPETKTDYREARAAYDAATAKALPLLDEADPLFDTDEQAWGNTVIEIERECNLPIVRHALNAAEAALLGEFYNQAQKNGGDLEAFGSPSLSIRNRLIDLALRA